MTRRTPSLNNGRAVGVGWSRGPRVSGWSKHFNHLIALSQSENPIQTEIGDLAVLGRKNSMIYKT